MVDVLEVERFLKNASIKIASFKEAKSLYADKIAPDFYIFDFLRDDEMGLSKCIASLFNPDGKHSQGNKFLNLFLNKIQNSLNEQKISMENELLDMDVTLSGSDFNWTMIDSSLCRVQLEHSTNEQRRIDIHLAFKGGELIGIENKPWAGDQKNQLSDYAKYLKQNSLGKSWLLIYLCNAEPSEDSIPKKELKELLGKGNMLILSYQTLIEWLETCICVTKAPIVRTFIEELIKFIKKEINGETDMVLAGQLSKVIQENLETAMQVATSIDEVKKNLIAKLKGDLQQKASQKNFKLQWKSNLDSRWPIYSGFGFNFNHSDEFEVWFEFAQPNLKGFYWGIRKRDKTVDKNEEHWGKINDVMNPKFGASNSTAWWPWWNYFEDEYKNWERNPKPWVDIQNGVTAEKIFSILDDVYEHLNQKNSLGLLKHIDMSK